MPSLAQEMQIPGGGCQSQGRSVASLLLTSSAEMLKPQRSLSSLATWSLCDQCGALVKGSCGSLMARLWPSSAAAPLPLNGAKAEAAASEEARPEPGPKPRL